MTTYALNIADCTALPKTVRMAMLTPVVRARHIVAAERGRLDGGAVILECEDTQAQAIILWLQDKFGGHRKVRAYVQGPRGGWRSVDGEQFRERLIGDSRGLG